MTLDPSRLAALTFIRKLWRLPDHPARVDALLAFQSAELARLQAEHTELRGALRLSEELRANADRELVRLQAERDEARADAGELVAIKTLVSDRSEVGTYAKVDAIIADLEAAEAARDEAQRERDEAIGRLKAMTAEADIAGREIERLRGVRSRG